MQVWKSGLLILLSISLFSGPNLVFAQAKKAKTSVLKPNNRVIRKLEDDLKKIDSSIDVTRKKIKTAAEINFLPDLYFMLAEFLLDKARIMFTIKKEKNVGVDPKEIDFTGEKRALQDAIDTYKMIEDRYPNFGDLDKVMFTMAHEQKNSGDVEGALKTYKRIIDKFSKSKYFTGAIIEVENIFFDKKDYDFALQQYQKAAALPVGVYTPIAQFKIGWVYIFKNQFMASLNAFERSLKTKVISFDELVSDEFKNSDIREEALLASVWPYSELSPNELGTRPELMNPLNYYESLAFDKASFRRLLNKLAKRMEMKKRPRDAADAYLRLLKLSDDPQEQKDAMENYYLQAKLAKIEYYPSWFSRKAAETLWQLKSEERRVKVKKGFMVYEPLLRDVATSLHKTGMRTKRKDDLRTAVASYEDYLWVFPKSKYRPEMELNMAEASYLAGDHVIAGIEYLDVLSGPMNSKISSKSKEILDSSIESFTEAFKDYESLTPLERLQSRSAFRTAAATFLKRYPNDKAVPTVQFNLAKSLYDEQRLTDAAAAFRNYLRKFPNHELAMQGAVLLLDCYYIRDDIKGLSSEGEKLRKDPNLSSAIKSKITSVIQQAQLKKVRSVAGDFNSKAYANKFLEFAKNNKGSALGETALLEAFASMKSSLDPRAYQVGEQFLGQYPDSPKSKDLIVAMAQMAMVSTEYRRAAKYLLAYGQKYKEDGSARESMLQAANIYEQLGELESAGEAFMISGDLLSAARNFKNLKDWNALNRVASELTGIPAKYYQGLSAVKSGKRKEGIELLRRVLDENPSSVDEKVMLAHSGILVSENDMEVFKRIGSGQSFSIPTLQQKAAAFQALDRQVQQVVSQGAGKWTIASIYLLGRLNLNFASYLQSARAPQGMNPAQFKQMIGAQIAGYTKSAKENFAACLKVAEENDLFSRYVEACRSLGKIDISENQEISPRIRAGQSSGSDGKNVKLELMKTPRDTNLLKKLALVYFNKKDYAFAAAIFQRSVEIEPQSGQHYADVGVCQLFMNQFEEAQLSFAEALKREPNNGAALRGLAGLYKKFGFSKKLTQVQSQFRGSTSVTQPVHPWMR